jgi:hypothetical protein
MIEKRRMRMYLFILIMLAVGFGLRAMPASAWFGDCPGGVAPCPPGAFPTIQPPGNMNISFDPGNDTYLKYWFNFTAGLHDPVHFDWPGLAFGLSLPLLGQLGAWVFVIIWFLYLFLLYERTQDVTPPVIIGILSATVMGGFFPQEALYPALIIFAACAVTIIIRVMKERI